MSRWNTSQVEDKAWMVDQLATLPDDEAMAKFDDADAERYAAEVQARVDQIVARARTLHMYNRGHEDTLGRLLLSQLTASKARSGYSRSSANSLDNCRKLIDGAILDTRPTAATRIARRSALAAVVVAIIASAVWSPLALLALAALALLAVLAGVGHATLLSRRRAEHLAAWLPGVWGLLSRDHRDPASLDVSEATAALKRDCNVATRFAVVALHAQLVLIAYDQPGWRGAWAIYVGRLAHACGYLSADELAYAQTKVAKRMQEAHATWAELAAVVDAGWRERARTRGAMDELDVVTENARALSDSVWSAVPFRGP